MSLSQRIAITVDTPQHAGLQGCLDYVHPQPLPGGTVVRVPLGRRTVTGVVWDSQPLTQPDPALKPIAQVFDGLAPLPDAWRSLVSFAASYYQRGLGELALSVLPPEMRKLDATQMARRLVRLGRLAQSNHNAAATDPVSSEGPTLETTDLTPEQAQALQALQALNSAEPPHTALLFGVTGSGKTEVYLRQAQEVLSAGRQVLMLVPEINLTPQLEARVRQRFPERCLVSLHSALTPAQRLQGWLRSHLGQADLVLGTRLAVFTPLPRLGLIVVDEEHDPSFKQQEGARYSARDLAVYRGHLEQVPVLLGSATPSLETWQRVLAGRYRRLNLSQRIGGGPMPTLRVVDMSRQPKVRGQPAPALAAPLVQAIEERRARGEQSLLLLNRRGYAPVLHCGACAWKSQCPHCTAWRVFHKIDRTLRCHHCGYTEHVPKACPECGNLDIAPVGRGTEKLEEQMAQLLPGARVARIDADTTRLKGTLDAQLAAVHAGEVDVLVGTQMVAKGHDFRRITLVAAVNPDAALFASDFRATERLFSLLMQAAGRAGREALVASSSEMWVQTWHPQHPLFAALRRHDFEAFAAEQLSERQSSGLPPFMHLALVRAEARDASVAHAFLRAAAQCAEQCAAQCAVRGEAASAVQVYAPVPPPVARVADVERVQMLVESASRAALQRFLSDWTPHLHGLRALHKGVLRWAIDVDPMSI